MAQAGPVSPARPKPATAAVKHSGTNSVMAGGKSSSRSRSKRSAAKGRALKVKVKSAKKRTVSSTRWLDRQLNDPYVAAAKRDGLRSRAAYKLMEIDEAHGLLKPGLTVVDLGSAPGGWSQVAAKRIGADAGQGRVIAIDIAGMEALPGVDFMQLDFTQDDAWERLKERLAGEGVDVVLSDMAAPSTGHRQTDHLRIIGLCEEAFEFACDHLKPGGAFLAKVLQGGAERELLTGLKLAFAKVRHVKPEASRAGSSELYVLAQGFRGRTSC